MTRLTRPTLAVAGVCALVSCGVAGCVGKVRGPSGVSGTGTAGSMGGGTAGASQPPGSTLPPPAKFTPAPTSLRRLTLAQYRNSVADLLGPGVTVSADFEADTSLSGFASIGAALVSLSPHLIEQLETSALSLAHQALSDTANRAALVGCNPTPTSTTITDDACVTQFITKLGRRAWRRPLTTDEVTAYVKLVNGVQTSTKSFFGGLEYGLAGLLESPHFIYREEIGAPLAGNAAMLSQGNGFATQVARLLASPRAATGTRTFFGEYYRLGDLDSLPQLPSIFPQHTDTIGSAMREETLRFLAELATAGTGDMRGIFDSPTTFVNAELAKLYGLPAVAGTDFAKTMLPATGLRVGYLGQGSFLALNAHSDIGSPTYRGKFIREMLMCQSIPPPPMNVPPLPVDAAGAAPQTMRQKLEMHRSVEPCKTCHTLMDPLGLAFENFDGMGAYRTMDAGQVIDASGDLDGMPFKNPRELATVLHDNPATMQCLARNMYRYATGHVEANGEQPAVDQIAQGFTDGKFQYGALVNSVVNSAGFVLAGLPAPDPTGAGGGPATGAGGAGGATGGTPDAGAAGGGVVTPPPAVLSYARDIAPIIASKCSPCHTTDAKAGLNWTYDTLVTNTNVTNATTNKCTYISQPPKRVIPGDPDHSLLWTKLTLDETQATVHGCGEPMPLPTSGKVLLTVELDAVHSWIQQGAKP
jgi:Protein of unknown function (DUF1588)/Protein of unknown function (DUF1592)/Protein of unknown function (DUF1595)/Protein of unknown function (DUF1585)/Protein of unknown function (DUF1587)